MDPLSRKTEPLAPRATARAFVARRALLGRVAWPCLAALALLVCTNSAQARRRHSAARSRLALPDSPRDPYASFKIDPRLPRDSRKAKAVKLTMILMDDALQGPKGSETAAKVAGLPDRGVRNVVFHDAEEIGDTRLFRAGADPRGRGVEVATLAPGVTEVQSNSPKLLGKVLGWTLRENPAPRRYLDIYAHGSASSGLGTDGHQTSPNGKELSSSAGGQRLLISLPALGQALRAGLKGRKLDAVNFHSCSMGNLEAMYEIKDFARYAVASEKVVYSTPNVRLAMRELFDDLAARNVPPREIVRQLAIKGYGTCGHTPAERTSCYYFPPGGYKTIAAMDLSKVGALKSAMNTLALRLTAALPKHGREIVAAYDETPRPGDELLGFPHVGDIWGFATKLLQHVPDPAVRAAAARVREAQRNLMVHVRTEADSGAKGLSVFMPRRDELEAAIQEGAYLETRFAKNTAWTGLLRKIAAVPATP